MSTVIRVSAIRRLFSLMGLLALAGCTTPGDLLETEPTIIANTAKDAKAYALCVLPEWQEFFVGTTMNETSQGYRLIMAVEGMQITNELLDIKRVEQGSEIRLYQRLPGVTMGRAKVTSPVNACL